MTKGGARARSGPPRDPNSGRSERRGKASEPALTTLPAEGHRGRAPAFPLPKIRRPELSEGSKAATDGFRRRELEIWRAVWKTPQAAAWDRETWRWPTIAEYCRVKAAVELDPDSNAALLSRLREYRNEIGLSPDGLKMNGWVIAADQVAEQAAKRTPKSAQPAPAAPTRRLRSVSGGNGS